MKISIVLGTRPEIIKFSSIIHECERLHLDYFVLHTGQHYSKNMSDVFFEQLELPDPKYNLEIGSGTHGKQTGRMLIDIEDVLSEECPDVILVLGDTNTSLAGSLAAVKLGIKVGHVEAGLRSHDRRMPEEINRILVDHCSDLLFTPSPRSKETLLREGIPENQIFVVGNTIVDALYENLQKLEARNNILNQLGLSEGKYMVATLHRQENVDNKSQLASIIKGLQLVQREFRVPLVFPVHSRALKQLGQFGTDLNGLMMVEPLDYFAFLKLESKANLVLTDSGGVQEESCILGVPCVTLRDNTEVPETLEIGANILAGFTPDRILEAAKVNIAQKKKWNNPFGDGKTGSKIIEYLLA